MELKRFAVRLETNARWMKEFLHGGRFPQAEPNPRAKRCTDEHLNVIVGNRERPDGKR